jgi:sarcosine oxidase subunit beta
VELLGQEIGFRPSGYVVGVGEGDVAALEANLATQRSVGVEVDLIDRDQVAAMWPVARLDDFAAFGFEPRSGHGDAYLTTQAFAAVARRAGAAIRQGSKVAGLLVAGDRVRGVRMMDGEELTAASVVVAAGPWSPSMLAPWGLELPMTVIREEKVLISPGMDLGRPPVFSDLVSLQYIRPEPGGQLLFGNSDLSAPRFADPDGYSNSISPTTVEQVAERMAYRFPGLADPTITSGYAGCYDVTPDWNPVISRTPVEGLVVAAGFSGHGYKISPAVGRLIADLVLDGVSSDADIPETDFRFSRYAEADPLVSPHPYSAAGQLR